MIKSLGKINRSGFGTKCKYRDSQAFFVPKKRFFYVRGGGIICFACLETNQRKKEGSCLFFWRDFFTIYSFKIGFEMSLGINRLFGLIDNDTFYSEFFFSEKFFFLLCELLLRQHNDFDRRKKKKSKEMNFCWSNLSFFFHLSSTWKQLFTMLNWCSWNSVLPTVSIFWWYYI